MSDRAFALSRVEIRLQEFFAAELSFNSFLGSPMIVVRRLAAVGETLADGVKVLEFMRVMSIRGIISAAAGLTALCFGAVTSAQADGHVRNNWTGFYAGIHGGKAWGDVDAGGPAVLTVPGVGGSPFNGTINGSVDVDGGIFGGQVGYNHQMGNLVVGAEVSYTGGSIDGSALGIGTGFLNDENANLEVNSLFQAVVRLGYAFDKALIYGKIGYANARLELDSVDTVPGCLGCTISGKERRGGLVLGAGFDFEIFSNVILGVDYSYINLRSGGATLDFLNPNTANTGSATIDDVDADIHAVTARLSYKFGGRSHRTSWK